MKKERRKEGKKERGELEVYIAPQQGFPHVSISEIKKSSHSLCNTNFKVL